MDQEPKAEKAEEQSGSLLLTYFEGDINSMVEAHFSRALSKATKPNVGGAKSKKACRPSKFEGTRSSPRELRSPPWIQTAYSQGRTQLGRHEELQTNPCLTLDPAVESSAVWPGPSRQGAGLVLSPMAYPAATSHEGLVMTDRQYSNSLLNLLHNDSPDLGTVMVAHSKPEFMPGWPRHTGFGDPMAPDHSLDSGVQLREKKDLYWY